MIISNAIVTAYCACQLCCGPSAKGITASGKQIKVGYVAAPRGISFGTKVVIDGKTYIVEDRTAKKWDGRWDIYTPSHKQALKNGKRITNIYVK